MKPIGIVRRVDDLGRIVIPKEMRKTLRIKEGDSLEIMVVSEKQIVLSKFSHIESIHNLVKQVCDTLYNETKNQIIITDLEKIISYSKGEFNVGDTALSEVFLRAFDTMERNKIAHLKELRLTNDLNIEKTVIYLKKIELYGDQLGAIIMIGKNYDQTTNELLINTVSELIKNSFV